jgi:hypothetical protein
MNVAFFAQFLPESDVRHFLPKFSDFLPNFYPLSLFKTIGNPASDMGIIFLLPN